MEALLDLIDTRNLMLVIFAVEQFTVILLEPVQLLKGVVRGVLTLVSLRGLVFVLPFLDYLLTFRELEVELIVKLL